jgi:hypothetical protein
MHCPAVAELRQVLNMSPMQIRAWQKRRARCRTRPRANGRTAVAELSTLAALLERGARTESDCKKAKDAVAFVKRHEKGRRKQQNPCSRNRVIALRDWGFHPEGCPVPKGCKSNE